MSINLGSRKVGSVHFASGLCIESAVLNILLVRYRQRLFSEKIFECLLRFYVHFLIRIVIHIFHILVVHNLEIRLKGEKDHINLLKKGTQKHVLENKRIIWFCIFTVPICTLLCFSKDLELINHLVHRNTFIIWFCILLYLFVPCCIFWST